MHYIMSFILYARIDKVHYITRFRESFLQKSWQGYDNSDRSDSLKSLFSRKALLIALSMYELLIGR
jgi:hypothetical protein